MLRRAISEGPAALVNLHQRRAEEAGGLGALPPPASHQLKVEDMGPVFGRLLSAETGLVDGSAGWAIDLQNMINQGNPNTSSALDPFLKIKDELHKKYPGAFTTGYIAGTLASNYLYGAPAKAEEAAGVALRRAASEEAAAAQQTAAQALREAELGNNPLAAALKKAQAELAPVLERGYTQGKAAGDDAYNAFLRGMDDAEQANQAGVSARDFARNKGIPSTLSDEEAAALDSQQMKMLSEGAGDNLLNTGNKAAAIKSVDALPPDIQPKIKNFFKGGSNSYTDFTVIPTKDGNYIARMTKPGNVPGSKAVYYKVIDSRGNTIRVYKETYDQAGSLVHIKEK